MTTRAPDILCIANQKGGVGKTTTAVSLGAALAGDGLRVLLVDLDPQGNATTGVGERVTEGETSIYQVLIDGAPVTEAIRPSGIERLDLIGSSLDLAGAEIELVSLFSRESRLDRALAHLDHDYDVVLLDCPPSLGLLTVNAFAAATHLLIPIQAEYYALEGLGQLLRTIELVRDGLNPRLEILGVVLTMFDGRTNLSHDVAREVRDHFTERTFDTVIPRAVRLSEAPGFGRPISVYDPSSRGARAYARLSREVAARLGRAVASAELSPLERLLHTVGAGADDGPGTGGTGGQA